MKTAIKTTRAINSMATLLAGVIALAFPVIFFSLQYQFHRASMGMEAHFGAALVSALINKNPEFWQFEEPRMESLLKAQKDEGLPEVSRIVDAKGHVIVQSPDRLAPPVMLQSADLLDSGNVVGRFEVVRSLRPLLFHTALAGLFGLVLGALVLLVLRVYPLRALKRALETLANEKKRAELILKSIGDGVITIDAQGIVLSSNPAAEKIFGYASEKIIGQNLKMLIPQPDRREREDHLARYLDTGLADMVGKEREVSAQRSDGGMFPMEIRISEFYLQGNRQFLGSMRDITERKQARDEVMHLNASLEDRVQQRTAQLEAANEELQAFSYSVSHDLRTPLSSIAGFSGLLNREIGSTEASRRTQHYLARIGASVVQMSDLIDSLLKLAQLSRSCVRWGSVDLSAMAQTVLNGYQESEPGRVAQLAIQPGLLVQCDPQLMRQVFENLMGNAWKFSRRQTSTRIAFRRDIGPDGEAVYAVRDNGAGFDMAYSKKLFGAFQRLHTVEEFAGTGIGLATVHRIITRHGGRIWAESSPGNGATFFFTLSKATLSFVVDPPAT